MFRRRGCLIGCGGLLVMCALASLLFWFVAVPRITNQLQNSVSEAVSTVLADELDPLVSGSLGRSGGNIHIPFQPFNREIMSDVNTADQVESLMIYGRGDRVVFEATVSDDIYEMVFAVNVDQDGYLQLTPLEKGNWFEGKVMDVLGGGFEHSVNEWLEEHNLIITDISVQRDGITVSVVGS